MLFSLIYSLINILVLCLLGASRRRLLVLLYLYSFTCILILVFFYLYSDTCILLLRVLYLYILIYFAADPSLPDSLLFFFGFLSSLVLFLFRFSLHFAPSSMLYLVLTLLGFLVYRLCIFHSHMLISMPLNNSFSILLSFSMHVFYSSLLLLYLSLLIYVLSLLPVLLWLFLSPPAGSSLFLILTSLFDSLMLLYSIFGAAIFLFLILLLFPLLCYLLHCIGYSSDYLYLLDLGLAIRLLLLIDNLLDAFFLPYLYFEHKGI